MDKNNIKEIEVIIKKGVMYSTTECPTPLSVQRQNVLKIRKFIL
jgi:hypothetical protein